MSLSNEQKKLRASGIGASEAPTLVGEGAGSLVDLWRSKVDPTFDPMADGGADQNDLVELGQEYEDPVCRIYARRTGTFLAPVATLRHPTMRLALATPDRARFTTEAARDAVANDCAIRTVEALEGADRLIEAKSTGSRFRKAYGRAGSGEVPEEKALQCVWQMGVTGLRVVDLPVLFMGEWGRRIEVFTVSWSETLWEIMYTAADKFWTDFVVPKKAPPPDASDEFERAIAALHPYDRKPALVADADDERLLLDFLRFRAVEKRAEYHKKLASQQLKLRMGEAGGLVSPTLGKVTWARSKDGAEVDWNMAANDALTLAGQCINAFGALREAGEHLKPELQADLALRLKQILPDATRIKSGFRSLRAYPKKGGPGDLTESALALTLEPLKLGEGK